MDVDDSSKAFVKWAELPKVLEQANTNGVLCTFLMKSDGSLLSTAGESKAESVSGALLANIWKAYSQAAQSALGPKEIKFMIIQCEDGLVAVSPVAKLVLGMYAQKSAEMGLLRIKMNALKTYLEEPLKRVVPL